MSTTPWASDWAFPAQVKRTDRRHRVFFTLPFNTYINNNINNNNNIMGGNPVPLSNIHNIHATS